MPLLHRPAAARGQTKTDWLDGRHTFSFGAYRDPAWHHYGALRVINEDWVAGGGGFAPHDHQDAEIITYVLDGELAHKDSLGSAATIRPNQLQMMRAGTGITHSEFNASATQPVHLLQIWLMPDERGLAPMYQDKMLNPDDRRGRWQRVAAPRNQAAAEGVFEIAADAHLFLAQLDAGAALALPAQSGRKYWLQVAKGALRYGEIDLAAGDGLALADEPSRDVIAAARSELLLFDLGG